jgi:hypothetical protein
MQELRKVQKALRLLTPLRTSCISCIPLGEEKWVGLPPMKRAAKRLGCGGAKPPGFDQHFH